MTTITFLNVFAGLEFFAGAIGARGGYVGTAIRNETDRRIEKHGRYVKQFEWSVESLLRVVKRASKISLRRVHPTEPTPNQVEVTWRHFETVLAYTCTTAPINIRLAVQSKGYLPLGTPLVRVEVEVDEAHQDRFSHTSEQREETNREFENRIEFGIEAVTYREDINGRQD